MSNLKQRLRNALATLEDKASASEEFSKLAALRKEARQRPFYAWLRPAAWILVAASLLLLVLVLSKDESRRLAEKTKSDLQSEIDKLKPPEKDIQAYSTQQEVVRFEKELVGKLAALGNEMKAAREEIGKLRESVGREAKERAEETVKPLASRMQKELDKLYARVDAAVKAEREDRERQFAQMRSNPRVVYASYGVKDAAKELNGVWRLQTYVFAKVFDGHVLQETFSPNARIELELADGKVRVRDLDSSGPKEALKILLSDLDGTSITLIEIGMESAKEIDFGNDPAQAVVPASLRGARAIYDLVDKSNLKISYLRDDGKTRPKSFREYVNNQVVLSFVRIK